MILIKVHLCLRTKLILKETRIWMKMTMLILLKVGLNITDKKKKQKLKNGNQGKISFHTPKEAQVEMTNNQMVDLVRNNLKPNNQLANLNLYLLAKDIVIQIYHLVLRTLEIVSTFIFHFNFYISSLLLCIIDVSPLSFTKHSTKDSWI